jgi:predicted glycosyltransferase involved in capsule biosynthesis
MNNKPKISLLIPFRSNGERSAQFDWLQEKWNFLGSDFEIIVSEDDGLDPYSKTIAINNAYKKSTAEILAMVDADVWLDPQILLDAAAFITSNPNSWIRPCTDVYRIKKTKTKEIISGDPSFSFPEITQKDCERVSVAVGGVFVFSKKQFETLGGMDPRFRGWGGEDNAWTIIMNKKFSYSQRWNKNLYHLWHPREKDSNGRVISFGQTTDNLELVSEYRVAVANKTLTNNLIAENKKRTGI